MVGGNYWVRVFGRVGKFRSYGFFFFLLVWGDVGVIGFL